MPRDAKFILRALVVMAVAAAILALGAIFLPPNGPRPPNGGSAVSSP